MWRERWQQRRAVRAVHEGELAGLLKDLGLLEDVKAGKLHCSICGNKVALKNIRGIFPKEGHVCLFCDRLECTEEVLLLHWNREGERNAN